MNLGPVRDYYADAREHERLAHLLTGEQRDWLSRMADVLPYGWVIPGMSTPPRGGVVPAPALDWPGGLRLVVPPPGPAGQARAR